MRILVFGAGALGSLLGAALSSENQVCLLARPAHVEAVRRDGLASCGALEGVFAIDAAACPDDVPWTPDIVLLTNKSYDTGAACDIIRSSFEPCPVATFQNGLGNLETMRRMLWSPEYAYGATTSMGAMLLEPGKILCAGRGKTVLEGGDRILEKLSQDMTRAGFPSETASDILPYIWEKAAVNMLINYTAGLAGLENRCVASAWDKKGNFAMALMEEVCAVALCEGVKLDPTLCASRARAVAEDTANNRCSLLRALETGRRTENNALGGEILSRGAKAGLRLPRVEALYTLTLLRERATDK